MGVPLFASSLERYHDALIERVAAVARSGRYILGPEVEAFERELADYLGVAHVVGVANGTDALTIALRSLGVRPGDDVVMPSFTFYATAEAAIAAGARPVFCDVDPETFCVTRATVERALTDRTTAIVPVHLFGNVAPIDDLRDLGPPVLEDAAQAIGASVAGRMAGSLGDAATLPRPVDGADPVYHLYVARHERADELVAALAAEGIGARGNYRVPVHLQPGMADHAGAGLDLPGTAE